ncbi:MAG: HU family DNA-binding protein [Proteobacteria bacterium]|nr:HU family DNA-binding protein [Pseudomonadota bacterium]
MHRAAFVTNLSKKLNLPYKDTGKILDVIFSEIEDTLIKEDQLTFPGFGTFKSAIVKAKTMKTPITGDKILHIEEKRTVRFKLGSYFKEKVNTLKNK